MRNRIDYKRTRTYSSAQSFIVLLRIARTKTTSKNSQGKFVASLGIQERPQDRHDDITVHGSPRVDIVRDEQASRDNEDGCIDARTNGKQP